MNDPGLDTPEQLAAHVTALERDWEKALNGNNAERLSELMADDWVIIAADGRVHDKSKALGVIRAGILRYDKVTFDTLDVRPYAGVAVVRGESFEGGSMAGHDFAEHYVFTDVFVRREPGWQSVLTHVTRRDAHA
jgi:ketosteroid isomerase-like protein